MGCGAFVAGSISMATASLCLIGRALSSTSPALYGYGARLVRIGVFLTMVQDLFLINGIHLTLRLIFRLSQTLFRLIVDFSNALYRVALRGVEAVTKMAKKVFIAVRSVVIWVFRVVFPKRSSLFGRGHSSVSLCQASSCRFFIPLSQAQLRSHPWQAICLTSDSTEVHCEISSRQHWR